MTDVEEKEINKAVKTEDVSTSDGSQKEECKISDIT